ncbi:MAG TPA: isoprenylcysteine carboxylmethyltransferase family protein [Terriglobales bacterium]|nr:isoprenylcysteine carboxylmethyltransferase family protein [Terriglobales bacterium]
MPTAASQKNSLYGLAQTILLCVFVAAVFLAPRRPLLLPGGTPRGVGSFLCLSGLALLVAGFVRLGRTIQVSPTPKENATLVTGGIYRWFRHPIYTAIVAMVAGIFLRQSTIAVAIATVIVIAYLAIKVRFEEQLLLARYPDYEEYRRHSWGLVPWPHWFS